MFRGALDRWPRLALFPRYRIARAVVYVIAHRSSKRLARKLVDETNSAQP
jgi:hypothetical protein